MAKTKLFLIPAIGLLAFLGAAAAALAFQGRLNGNMFQTPQNTAGQPPHGRTHSVPQKAQDIEPLRKIKMAEFDKLASELEMTREALQRQAGELSKQEERLAMYRREVEAEEQALDLARGGLERREADLLKREKAIADRLVLIDQVEAANMRKSAAVYEAMEPAAAAASMLAADPATAARILYYMKEKKTAKVLAEFPDPKTASELLERFKSLQEMSESQ